MGIVYRVLDRELNREVAMKVIRGPAPAFEATSVESAPSVRLDQFLEEARHLAQLDHPGIVPVHDIGIDPSGRIYFTMKLAPGRGFHQILPLARSSVDGWNLIRALWVLVTVAEAVGHAHARGIVHCDLKPQNILVAPDDRVTVIDWGLSIRIPGPGESTDCSPPLQNTPHSTRSIFGTPTFMAPEQHDGNANITPSTDVFALGLMLKGILPILSFPSSDKTHSRPERLDDSDHSDPGFRCRSSSSFVQLYRRATSRIPALRPVHAAEFADQLKSCIRSAAGLSTFPCGGQKRDTSQQD